MQLDVPVFLAGRIADGDEAQLVALARTDPRAFAVLYRRHYRAIAGYIHRRVGDVHATEDLVADTFLAAMRGLPRYRPGGSPFLAWLYGIASRLVNAWARRQRRAAMRRLSAQSAIVAGGAAGEAAADIDGELARAALLTLPPRFQTVLALHYLEGMPVADIALALGCREGTVKSRLARGRERLRQKLKACAIG